jgi:hypothetical protein
MSTSQAPSSSDPPSRTPRPESREVLVTGVGTVTGSHAQVADEPQAPARPAAGAGDARRWRQVRPTGAHSRLPEHELGDRLAERGVRQGADVGHLPLAEAVGGRRREAAEVPMVVGMVERFASRAHTCCLVSR